ncbi:Nucleotide-binding alpha-beta plait [Penicillium cf. griseofulvum]|nr:Nucleotide-binding alpha-beta plait [Penicillium cf. griseofulvum]
MNSIRQVQALNKRELEHAIPPEASWHADYRDTAYIYIGGLPFDLSEGDIETGKSKGFAFLKYEDQRSTDLAVDNLGGATVMGRLLRVDHARYKRKDEEEEQDNVARLMGDPSITESKGKEIDRRKATEIEERRPILKEEKELEELIRNHDEEDPMKEFLIEEKKEEIATAIQLWNSTKKSSRRRDDSRERSSRHHRRHRSRSPRERRHRDDHSPDRERRSRYRSSERGEKSRRDRSPRRSRSPESRRHRSDRDEHDRRH